MQHVPRAQVHDHFRVLGHHQLPDGFDVVRGSHAPDKTKPEARRIINTWVRNGVLVSEDYENPKTRKTVKGLCVVNAKRPT